MPSAACRWPAGLGAQRSIVCSWRRPSKRAPSSVPGSRWRASRRRATASRAFAAAIGGRLGLTIEALPADDLAVALFAESTGRFVLEVARDDVAAVVAALAEPVTLLGTVNDAPVLALPGCRPVTIDELVAAFTGGSA